MKLIKKLLKIKVTEDDIAKGIRGDGASCPIARACKRMGFEAVDAMPESISLSCPKTKADYRGRTPEPARRFMSAFDSKLKVSPFEFEIEITGYEPEPNPPEQLELKEEGK